MATTIGEAVVGIRADTSKARKDVEGLGGSFKRVGAIIGSGLVLGAAGKFFGSIISDARESIKVQKLTASTIKSTGGVANVTAAQVGSLADSLSKVSGVDDELIQGGENLLLTFKNIRNEAGKGNDVFNRATKVALDLSVAFGQDMKSSAIQLGKALDNPIKGVTALQRVGVSFTQQQKDQIAVLVESGKTLEAQRIILKEVESQVGGAAAAAADPVSKLSVAVGNAKEALGTALLPVLTPVVDKLAALATGFADLNTPTKAAILGIGTFAVTIGPLISLGRAIGGSFRGVREALQGLSVGFRLGERVSGSFSSSLGAVLRGGLGPLTIGLVAGGAALLSFFEKQRKARAEINEFKNALKEGGKAAQDAAQKQIIANFANEKAQATLKQVGSNTRDLTKAIAANNKQEIDAIATRLDAATGNELAGRRVREMADHLRTARGETKLAKDAEKQLGITTGELGGKAEEAKNKFEDFRNEINRLFEPTLNLSDAQVDFEAKIDSLSGAIKENGNTFDLNTEKGRANVQAQNELVRAGAGLVSSLSEVAEAGKLDNEQKAFAIAQLEGAKKQYPQLRTQIDAYIKKIGEIPIETKTKVVFDTSQAKKDLQNWKDDLNGLFSTIEHFVNRTGAAIPAGTRGRFPVRDAGGPVSAGSPYMVGVNRRPELFIPRQNGQVLTEAQIAKVVGAGGGSSRTQTNYITIAENQMERYFAWQKRQELLANV